MKTNQQTWLGCFKLVFVMTDVCESYETCLCASWYFDFTSMIGGLAYEHFVHT